MEIPMSLLLVHFHNAAVFSSYTIGIAGSRWSRIVLLNVV